MQMISVTDKKTENQFLQVPLLIYKNDPNWIRPLDKDILDVFNPKKKQIITFRKGYSLDFSG
jgi:hypothetical protein